MRLVSGLAYFCLIVADIPETYFIAVFSRILAHSSPGARSMKGILVGLAILVGLYFADQRFMGGKYTAAIDRMAIQIRHSFGI